ncbi:integrase core domain-containing protein [Nocardia tengchongensis]|uniref:integrase core domain-containing protein n=1 Tax=Nocardia tengchongensis TaxID=2055889 RepID=UPI00360DABE3
MGDTGICWDKSPSESPWSTFKHEYYYRHVCATKAELAAAVDIWIDWYTTRRCHSAIGMISPVRYEQSLTAAAESA